VSRTLRITYLRDLKRPLCRGDIVRHVGLASSYVILEGGKQPIAVRHVTIDNPSEWELVEYMDDDARVKP
jgi:hypothetical protein